MTHHSRDQREQAKLKREMHEDLDDDNSIEELLETLSKKDGKGPYKKYDQSACQERDAK